MLKNLIRGKEKFYGLHKDYDWKNLGWKLIYELV